MRYGRIRRSGLDRPGVQRGQRLFGAAANSAGSPYKIVLYHRYPKLGVISKTDGHFIWPMQAGRGRRPDVDELAPLLEEADPAVRLARLVADAGYDPEGNHRLAREHYGIRIIIPLKLGRPTLKPATGYYRR